MRRGCEKFDADALAFVGRLSQKDDARFLLFLRERVGEDDHRIHDQRLVQIQEAAVCVDHDGFAGLPEAAIVGVFSGHNHTHPHKNAGTSANFVVIGLGHGKSMLRHFAGGVNESVNGLFRACNASLPLFPRAALAPQRLFLSAWE